MNQYFRPIASTVSARSNPLGFLFAVALLAGCVPQKDAGHKLGIEQLEAAGPPMAAVASTTLSAPSSTPANLGDSASIVAAKADTNDPAVQIPSVKGRLKRDSIALVRAVRAGMKDTRWPVKSPAPLPGSILPGKRIVAFYGNPLSKRMGILGELPPAEMLAKFDKELDRWRKADPTTPVQPALHLIAVVAQGSPGRDGKYRLRMADSLIERVASWAAQKNAVLFLDIQVGSSTVEEEVPRLAPFLKRPNVHLGIDPEFSMKGGEKPGTKIGTMNASDVNFCTKFLADLVTQNKLPPKVLVVHRFTRKMLTGSAQIRLDPRVQIVIDMDGWGGPWLKFDSYRDYVEAEPVQFTGFKLFYHNDTKKGEPILTPEEVLRLHPRPLYIQYQ